MKTISTVLLTVFSLLSWCLAPAHAQQATSPRSEKKIVITKRTMDADGTQTTETIVKKGKAAENFDVEQYVKENKADNVELDVRVNSDDDVSKNIIIRNRINADNMIWTGDGDHEVAVFACTDNKAFLGVEEDSDEDPDAEGLTVEVIRGSAADKAGLRSNDILLQLNGRPVNEWDELTAIIGEAKPGDHLQVSYSRNGKTFTAEPVLTTRSDVNRDEAPVSHGFLGIRPADDDQEDPENGVRIEVVDESAAAKAGLQDGDVLLQLNDADIRDWEDITDFMAYTKPDESINIRYQRDAASKTVSATLGAQKIEDFQVAKIRVAPEDMKYEFKVREKEACLGVYSSASGEGDQRGARVSDFTKESAARESEMVAGDVITAVNGVRVTGHDELWDQIATYKPGDKVAVEFLRDNQPKQIQATLKACRDNSNHVFIFENKVDEPAKVRDFYLWNWNEQDQNEMHERRVITIHRGAEGDAVQVVPPPAPTAAPDRKLQLSNFKAYPNPSKGQVTVEFHSEPLPTVVSLLDVSGRQLFREELNAFNGDYYQQFDLTEYAKGAIIIHVLQGDKVYTEQIIVN